MASVQDLQDLYDQGRSAEVLTVSQAILDEATIDDAEEREILALRAWAYYRQRDFEAAREEARRVQKTGSNESALRCLAAIAAYHDRDPGRVDFFMRMLLDSPGRDNTRVIYAREPGDPMPKSEILAMGWRWLLPDPEDPLNTANLLNNVGRWLHAKRGDTREDWTLALGFLLTALGLYGHGDENVHHRAGLWYWISVVQEGLLGKRAAISAAENSLSLWERQCDLDPNNSSFERNLKAGRERVSTLEAN